MNRTKDTFSGFLSDQKQLDQESDLIPLIIHYLKAQLGDTTVSALEHLFQPACYAELNLSGNEAEFKHLLLAISKEQINHKKPLFLISNYTLFPLIDKAGRVNYVFGFTPSAEIDHRRLSGLCTEIQTIWQLVEAFHARKQAAAAASKAALVSRLTHDMNALATLSTAVSENDPALREKIEYTHRLSKAVMLFLNDIDLHKVRVPVKDLIESIFESLSRPSILKINLNFMDKFGFISADIEYIEQALQAIVENAIRAIQLTGNEIDITVKRRKNSSLFMDYDWLEINVADNGVGIPEEYLTEIKKPLFTTWKNEGHVGLGLTQAEKIVQAHGGALEIESRFPGGTISTLYLPLQDDANKE